MLFPASEAEMIDTWNVAGLRGTGSHDFEVKDATVPAERSASLITDSPRCDGPLYAFPVFGLLALSIASVGLGIARGRDRRPGRARHRQEADGLDADPRPALRHPGRRSPPPRPRCARPAR